jgi:hypothetical protein
MPDLIDIGGFRVDLTRRVVTSSVVAASPSGSSETLVAKTPAFDNQLQIVTGCIILCTIAYTIGTSGNACTVQLRQGVTQGSGTVIFTTGAQTGGHNTAGQLVSDEVSGWDASPGSQQAYHVSLTVASGAAASTVSKVTITAIAI